MRILMIGGIYGMSPSFRARNLQETTETLLERGLTARGHEVITDRHQRWNRLRAADIVHVHHLASSCPQFTVRRRTPLVFTRHATKPLPLAHSLVLQLTQQRAQGVIALSEAERASLASDVPPERLHRIYNGVDADAFYPPTHLRKAPSEAEPWRLVYVGQLIELKRVHLAIQLIAQLKSHDIAAHLTLVTQRDTLKRELLSYAQSLGVVGSLTWLGPRCKSEVADLMRQAHLLVVPSRTEALSTVVTEACFAALPVAAFNVGGMKEQLPKGMCSLEVTETALYTPMVMAILRNYDHYVSLFAEHSSLAVTRFSIPRMVDEHVKLYEQLVTA